MQNSSTTKKIILDTATHKGIYVVLLKFPFDNELANVARQLPDAKWSNSNKAWVTPYSVKTLHQLKNLFEPVCEIDASLLKQKVTAYVNDPKNNILNAEVQDKIEKYKQWLQSKRYSQSTIGTYTEALKVFLKFFNDKNIAEISNDDIIKFNNEYILKNKLSSSFQNQIVNAIKLFFRTVENKTITIESIHRPKPEHPLPNVLSKEEIKKILQAHTNIKHKTMLSLIYACGLRRSELLNLRAEHIDSNRGLVIIKKAKGKKDRIAPISDKIISMLREYYKAYKPSYWLFEGQNKGEQYTAESLQSVLKQALTKTKITKPVTLHWLRHSYATHLLESGTDLRYIQELLGHKSSRTTEIYTHVSKKSIQKIKSPFDDL
jgi:integrase/recombinase XerD